ncbi:MAG: dissimilatory-type sulfite reductase subunit alpha [Deltaproteobacteria bacterium]|nr:dissimilatory-type sulfite reductase subunit alpha [Deltaproteobacteria bacterium]
MADQPKDNKTPMLDELEKGKWPSFVREIKRAAEKSPKSKALLTQLERSYHDKVTHWKHGGLVGVRGYGGGVIGRYSDLAEELPDAAHFHTVRVNQTSGWFYSTKSLRKICDMWEKRGSGLTNMHGSTGDMVLLGTTTDQLEPLFSELTAENWDLGGSGSNMRTPSCCVGPARCEFACYDTLAVTYDITQTWQDELHRPQFPYKYKFKMAGCPNDCVASQARSDMAIIGTWRDDIRVDQAAVAAYAKAGTDINTEVVGLCPSKCMNWDGKELKIANKFCRRCMHCINVLPKALRPGTDKGATIMIGGKAPILQGAQLCAVLVPFMKMEPPYKELKDLVAKIWEFWGEYGKGRERIGELIQRVGLGQFLEAIELEPVPQMVNSPRANPFIFYEEYYEAE